MNIRIEPKESRACPVNSKASPRPGEVGADKRADCPICGKRVRITVRGLYARHGQTYKTYRPGGRESA